MKIYTTFWPLDGADDIGVNLLGKKKRENIFVQLARMLMTFGQQMFYK